jgi:hypothetical protein
MIVEYTGSVLGACSVYLNKSAVAAVLQDCVIPMYDESCTCVELSSSFM